jgi:hypothetical protein
MDRTTVLYRIAALAAVIALMCGTPLRVIAQEARPGWKKSASFPAQEAVQAAAADEEFVYAISSTTIGRYSRTSQQRLDTSSGDARHLNSGFLWQGRLYCAHSNYPLIPERSEIRVLDPHTMRLSIYKDFGNYGGSLTWAVRHDGDWWCNFARYGTSNRKTFLVRLDEDWREKDRWTYPDEVLREIGSYSLSGGIWDGDSLLVTGHDKPLVYRVRLPKCGSILEYVETLCVPFTGQGIARDPLSGGLVGIHRARREFIFARPQ